MDRVAQKIHARTLLQQGKVAESHALLTNICAHPCSDSEALYLLANASLLLGQYSEAAANCEKALALRSDVPAIHFCHAMAMGAMGRIDSAKSSLESALRIDPNHIESRIRLGAVCFMLGDGQNALRHYKLATKAQPNNVELNIRLGDINLALGKIEPAKSAYRKALRTQPMEPNATAGLAAIAVRSNDPRAAYLLIQKFLEQQSGNASIAAVYADLSGEMGLRDEAIDYLKRVLEVDSLPLSDRRRLMFSLGKLLDAQARYDTAFEYYRQANDLGGAFFDPWASNDEINRYMDFWSAEFLMRAPRARKRSKGRGHVFIVGMPRSGTSLVEQIIASHPRVYGAGELQEINDFAAQLPALTKSNSPYPFCLSAATEAVLDSATKQYFKSIEKRAGNDGFSVSTDKMPNNYWHLGLIRMMFPSSKIIHCIRDPRDNCLSCYFQNFAGQHPYADDLFNLGMYYRQYEKLMRHWRAVLDIQMLDVRYEELVADPEKISRQLLEYCGLEWDDCVLRYHKSKRSVVTSSFDQVTKPVYRESVGRWQYYHAYLDPLYRGLSYQI